MVGDEIGVPGFRRATVAEVAVGCRGGCGAGGPSGFDVAPVVADVEGAPGWFAQDTAGVQDRQGGWLGGGRGVAADDAGGLATQAQGGNQRIGVAGPLVGDDTPGNAAFPEVGEQFRDSVKEPGVDTEVGGVEFEKALGKARIIGALRVNAEAGAEQPAHPLRGKGTQGGQGERRQAFFDAQAVQRGAQIGGGIGQGAVKVEEDRLKHGGCSAPGN